MRATTVFAVLIACGGATAAEVDRVRAHHAAVAPHPGAEVSVEEAPEPRIEGVRLYDVTVLTPDHPGDRCAVAGNEVFCGAEQLPGVIRALDLASHPDKLTDAQWLGLWAFTQHTQPLSGPDGLVHLGDYAPAAVRAKIAGPRVSRTAEAVKIVVFREVVVYAAFPSGPKSIERVSATIGRDGTITSDVEAVWSGR